MDALLVTLLQLALALLFFGAAGLTSSWALLRGFKPRSVVLTGFGTLLLLVTALFILGRDDASKFPWVSFQQYFEPRHFEEEWKTDREAALKMGVAADKLDGFKDDYQKYFYDLLPGWVLAGCLVGGLLAYYVFSLILSRVTPRVPKAMAFREWVIPEPLVFGLIVAGILKIAAKDHGWMDILGSNLLFFFFVVYVLGGFCIVSFFLHKWRLPATLRVLSYLILVQLPLDAVCALGVLDIWFDFRKIKTSRPEIAS